MWFAWIEVGLLASAVQTLFDRNLLGAVRTTKSIYLTLKPADSLEAEKWPRKWNLTSQLSIWFRSNSQLKRDIWFWTVYDLDLLGSKIMHDFLKSFEQKVLFLSKVVIPSLDFEEMKRGLEWALKWSNGSNTLN